MTLMTIVIFAITCFVIIDKKEGKYTVEGRRRRKMEKEQKEKQTVECTKITSNIGCKLNTSTIKTESKKQKKKELSEQITIYDWKLRVEAINELEATEEQVSFLEDKITITEEQIQNKIKDMKSAQQTKRRIKLYTGVTKADNYADDEKNLIRIMQFANKEIEETKKTLETVRKHDYYKHKNEDIKALEESIKKLEKALEYKVKNLDDIYRKSLYIELHERRLQHTIMDCVKHYRDLNNHIFY